MANKNELMPEVTQLDEGGLENKNKKGVLERAGQLLSRLSSDTRAQLLSIVAGVLAMGSGCGLAPNTFDTNGKNDTGIQGPRVAGEDADKLGSKTSALSITVNKQCTNPYFKDKNTIYCGHHIPNSSPSSYGIQKFTIKPDGSLSAPVKITNLPKAPGAQGLSAYLPDVVLNGQRVTISVDNVGLLLVLNTTNNTWDIASQHDTRRVFIDSGLIYVGASTSGVGYIDPKVMDSTGKYWKGYSIIIPISQARVYYPTPGKNGLEGFVYNGGGYTYYCEYSGASLSTTGGKWACITINFPHQLPTKSIVTGIAYWCDGKSKNGRVASGGYDSKGKYVFGVADYNDCPVPAQPEVTPEQPTETNQEVVSDGDMPEVTIEPNVEPTPETVNEPTVEKTPDGGTETSTPDGGPDGVKEGGTDNVPEPPVEYKEEKKTEPVVVDEPTTEKTPDGGTETSTPDGGNESVPEAEITPEKQPEQKPEEQPETEPKTVTATCGTGLAGKATYPSGTVEKSCDGETIVLKKKFDKFEDKNPPLTVKWREDESSPEANVHFNGKIEIPIGGYINAIEGSVRVETHGSGLKIRYKGLSLAPVGTDYKFTRLSEDEVQLDFFDGEAVILTYSLKADGKDIEVDIARLDKNTNTMKLSLEEIREFALKKFSEQGGEFPTRPDAGTTDTGENKPGCGGCNVLASEPKDKKQAIAYWTALILFGGAALGRRRRREEEEEVSENEES